MVTRQITRAWTCGVCNQLLIAGAPRCSRCGTPVSPPDHAPYGAGGILGGSLPGYVAAPEPSQPNRSSLQRRRWLAAGIVISVVASLFGVVWATSGNGPKPRVRPTTTASSAPTTYRTTTSGTRPPIPTLPPRSTEPTAPRSTAIPPSTGTPPSTGPTTTVPTVPQLAERWKLRLGRMAQSGAVNGNQVVVATRSGTVVSVDARSGKVRWRRTMGAETPAGVVVHQGVVITRAQPASALSGDVVALGGGNGKTLWRRPVTSSISIFDKPAAVGDGRVYVESGGVVALDVRTGRQTWKVSDTSVARSPVFGAGRVVVASYDGKVSAYDAGSGHRRWTTRIGRGTLAAVGDLVLVQSTLADETLSAIDIGRGAVRWHIDTNGLTFQPAIGVLDNVVVPTTKDLVAVSPRDGSKRWTAEDVPKAVAVAAAGDSVYATSYKLSVVNGRTGQLRAEGRLSDISIFPPVPAGDTTVVIMGESIGGYR